MDAGKEDQHLSIPRLSWESEHEWTARMSFLDSNKDFYFDDRLASLSMAWSNWKFMGCNYGESVQAILEDCDSRLPPEVDEAINKLIEAATPKVKFVKASEENLGTRTGPPQGGKRAALFIVDNNLNDCVPCKKPSLNSDQTREFILYVPSKSKLDTFEFNVISALHESCQKSKQTIEFVEDYSHDIFQYNLLINGKDIATGSAAIKKDAKRLCAENGFTYLRKDHEIIVKDEINHDHVDVIEKSNLVKAAYTSAPKLTESNLGNKLLRKMGWDGSSGVGKNEHGIVEPVFVDAVEGRRGVGHEFENRSVKKGSVEQTLLDFIRDQTQGEIKFSSDLSKDDRSLVHRMCQKYHLKHKSFGKNADRYLVVSKK